MSQDPIGAVTSAQTNALTRLEGLPGPADGAWPQAQAAAGSSASGGGAFVQLAKIEEPQAASAMNLQALGAQFSTGLQDGFYAKDVGRLMSKLDQSRQPASGVTFGDVTVELLNVQAKVGIADAFSKVASKLSEGLQTLVVKQG